MCVRVTREESLFCGRQVVGQERDAAEIGFEIVGGAPGSAITMLRNTAGRGKYTMGPDEAPVTFEEMVKIIEETDDATFAGMKLRIKGDEVLKGMAEDRKAGMEDVRHAFEEVVGNRPTEAFSSLHAEEGPRCRKVGEDTRTYLVPVGSRDAGMDLGVVRRIWAPGEGNVPVLGVLEALVRLR